MTSRLVRSATAGLAAAALTTLVAGCGGGGIDSGGLTAGGRKAAQTALTSLDGTNVSLQLLGITNSVQAPPAACHLHVVSKQTGAFRVYVFWIPWLGSEPYTWLDMQVGKDKSKDTFDLGTEKAVLPGGVLTSNGRSVNPYSQDTTLLSRYGPAQARKSREVMRAHAGDAFTKPGANCQLLTNGYLRLVPDP